MMPKVETFLKPDEIADIEELAEKEGISRSAWIRKAILIELEKEDERYYKGETVLGT